MGSVHRPDIAQGPRCAECGHTNTAAVSAEESGTPAGASPRKLAWSAPADEPSPSCGLGEPSSDAQVSVVPSPPTLSSTPDAEQEGRALGADAYNTALQAVVSAGGTPTDEE